MSQNSLVIPNTGTLSGLTMVNDVNALADSLNTVNSGGSAPASAAACSLWADTTTSILKQRNPANTAWGFIDSMDDSIPLIKSSNYTALISDYKSLIVATAALTITLPLASVVGSRWRLSVLNSSTTASPNVVSIARAGGDTFDQDAATSVIVPQGGVVEVYCDGTSKFYTRGRLQRFFQYGTGVLPASGTGFATVAVTFPNIPSTFATVQGCVCTPQRAGNAVAGGVPNMAASVLITSGFTAIGDLLGYTTFNQTVAFSYVAWGI